MSLPSQSPKQYHTTRATTQLLSTLTYSPHCKPTLHPRLPVFYSHSLFCLSPTPISVPRHPYCSNKYSPYLSFNPFSPSSARFSSPYLETPFCSPNHYPRMPNTPPSLANPALFPHLVESHSCFFPNPLLQSTHYLSFPPTFPPPPYPRFRESLPLLGALVLCSVFFRTPLPPVSPLFFFLGMSAVSRGPRRILDDPSARDPCPLGEPD